MPDSKLPEPFKLPKPPTITMAMMRARESMPPSRLVCEIPVGELREFCKASLEAHDAAIRTLKEPQ